MTKDEWIRKQLATLPPLSTKQREDLARLVGSRPAVAQPPRKVA